MEEDSIIERLPLEHPLPEEIQKLDRDETVCQFCGVSYLIHREVKALEDQLKKVQEELKRYEGSEERERKLREDLERATKDRDAAQFTVQEKNSSMEQLMTEIKHKDIGLKEAAEAKQDLEDRVDQMTRVTEAHRKQQESLKGRLPTLQSSVQQQKSELQNIQSFVHQMGKALRESSDRLKVTVQTVCSQESEGTSRLKETLSTLQQEQLSWQNGKGDMEVSLRNAKAEVERLSQVEGLLKQKETQYGQLSSHVERLQAEVDTSNTQRRTLTAEAAQFKELLKSKCHEIEELEIQHRKREQITEQLSSKLQHELKQRGMELQVALSDYRKLEQQIKDKERGEEEVQRQATLSLDEKEQIRGALMRAQEECNALKSERDLMISSHQNRIEQLRVSFKQKLIDAEKWPSKMDETLQNERTRHSQQLQELEEKMKEAFRIELDIEKQKHQELTERYKMEFQEKESKFKGEMRSLAMRNKSELSQVEKQMSSLKTQASAGEESLKREVQGLKSVIGDLENRLGKAGTENDDLVRNLRAELREAEQDLMATREETKAVEDKLTQSKEEILFLQETVRRECEERFELTETLSEAKEQLLVYQRHGSLGSTSRPTSATKSQKPETSLGTNRKTSTGSMQGGQNQRAGSQSPGSKVSSSSINIGFDPNQVRPPGHRREGSMSDSRKRIAAAIGRR
ncbi:uncharacterized protein [Asterias amurensis]|uniref:uncharacterized protein n=1 Tax=Asterias amurensis TaxID=7602 RepID=UPI003AB86F70